MNKGRKPAGKYLWIILLMCMATAITVLTINNNSRKNAIHAVLQATSQEFFHNITTRNDSVQQTQTTDISVLTHEDTVIAFVKKHYQLPEYYITKKEASASGWVAAKGNLCDVLPGKAIGGDYFGNREGRLPKQKNRKYYEADLNYNCGRRNADRLVFSNDGLIFITKDHYKSFQEK